MSGIAMAFGSAPLSTASGMAAGTSIWFTSSLARISNLALVNAYFGNISPKVNEGMVVIPAWVGPRPVMNTSINFFVDFEPPEDE